MSGAADLIMSKESAAKSSFVPLSELTNDPNFIDCHHFPKTMDGSERLSSNDDCRIIENYESIGISKEFYFTLLRFLKLYNIRPREDCQ